MGKTEIPWSRCCWPINSKKEGKRNDSGRSEEDIRDDEKAMGRPEEESCLKIVNLV
jgi:hypothetical protein